MKRGLRGFTLVETLVVVSIIALLTALLLTNFRGRESAHITLCLSNIKQMGLAMTLYADDNDDCTFPGLPASTNYLAPWKAAMQPYVRDDRVYYCPSDKYARVGSPRQIQARYSSYQQWCGPGAVYQDSLYHYYIPGIPDPAKNVNLSEWWFISSLDDRQAGHFSATPHDTTYSVLYWDGHAKHEPNPWVIGERQQR